MIGDGTRINSGSICLWATALFLAAGVSACAPPAAEMAAPVAPMTSHRPPDVADPNWPLVRGGTYFTWLGRVWNTRRRDRVWQEGPVGTLGQHNGTGTYLGEDRADSGSVQFEVKFDAGYLAPAGGGKHFIEIMSWLADRGDRKAIAARPWSRVELANLGDRPRCIVWNYTPDFRGQANQIVSVGPAFQPDRWYRIRLDWHYQAPTGRVTVTIDDRTYQAALNFAPNTIAPGRYFMFGHVETTQPEARLHYRSFQTGRMDEK